MKYINNIIKYTYSALKFYYNYIDRKTKNKNKNKKIRLNQNHIYNIIHSHIIIATMFQPLFQPYPAHHVTLNSPRKSQDYKTE